MNSRICTNIALGLRSAIDNMAGYEDDALQIQITVFEEHQLADESQVPTISHQELLEKLRAKVIKILSLCLHTHELTNNFSYLQLLYCVCYRFQTHCTTLIYKTYYCKCRKWITMIRKCKYIIYLVHVCYF